MGRAGRVRLVVMFGGSSSSVSWAVTDSEADEVRFGASDSESELAGLWVVFRFLEAESLGVWWVDLLLRLVEEEVLGVVADIAGVLGVRGAEDRPLDEPPRRGVAGAVTLPVATCFRIALICSMMARPVGFSFSGPGHDDAMVSALTLERMLGFCSMSLRRSWVSFVSSCVWLRGDGRTYCGSSAFVPAHWHDDGVALWTF